MPQCNRNNIEGDTSEGAKLVGGVGGNVYGELCSPPMETRVLAALELAVETELKLSVGDAGALDVLGV
eukprot:m.293002 g.293002  ORF g.293002 m.293002 type:complete len:68 (+) comp12712_c0_seq1:111-314(+)